MTEAWIVELTTSAWLFPALFALVVADAFLVVLPSETAVVALAALAGATGAPSVVGILLVAAVGAIMGDSLCFAIGRAVGHDRWRWQRRGRIARAIARVRKTVLRRPAVLIFTARYIPFARIAVNLSAGASGMPYRRYLPLSAAAGCGWALYNTAVGLLFGRLLSSTPVLAVAISVVVAFALGVVIDRVVSARHSRREAQPRGDQG